MRTRSSSHLIAESSTTPKRRNRRRSKQRVEPFSLEETPVVTMADQRTMTELLRAPTKGYAEAIVIASVVASVMTSAMVVMFKQHQVTPAPASVKAIEESCVTCGGAHSYRQCPATDGNTFSGNQDNIQGYVSAAAVNYNQGTTGYRPQSVNLDDLGAAIYLMPYSVWKKLSLPDLTSTRMTLELADQSITFPIGVAEDVFVKVGKFHFPADFVVVDYDADPRVPLILGRPFLRTARALIDVYGEEITLRFNDEAITFKVGQTSRYSYNNSESVNRIDVIDVSCEEYAQEVLGFLDSSKSGNPTPSLDPILSTSFPSLTPFEGGDFILEEIKACLTNDSIPPGIDDADFDPEGDLLLLEKLLNDDPSSPLPPKELHFEEIKTIKSSIDDPPELELKDLPSHLEYAFLEGTDKLPVIIYKELKDEENPPF
ncbi:reverse transcriptase domain-containing protein [Tanacetum coccineum]